MRARNVLGVVVAGAGAATVWRLLAARGQRSSAAAPGAGGTVLTNRTARTAELVRLSSKAGAGYAATAARSRFAGDERKAELRSEFELRTAAQVVESLGHMKGAVMKIGQMASYLDQGLPEPVRDALAQLRTDAPPMAPELAAEVVESELGRAPDDVFAEWSPIPLAAASIGQVHRAVTRDGAEVAVKVQYPGVDEAIRSDLESSDLLFSALAMLFPGLDPKPIVGELRARLVEELDYRNEARNQQRFADAFEGHPTIHVPRVHADLSTGRVLTSDLAEGATFSEVLGWSQAERDLAAETIFRYAFGGIYQLGIFNGDPHPGNYLFRPGGRVTFLDYGLCKEFGADELRWFERLIRAMCFTHDMAEFSRLSEEIGFVADTSKFSQQLLFDYFSHFYELVIEDRTMTVTPEYASDSVRRFFDLSGPYAEIIRSANLPPSMVIIQRINLGLFSLMAELGATANWRRIAEEIWPWADGAPSTPMGEAIAAWRATRGERASDVGDR
jgi:predicted unusual protein kinase regulating ubiquinone biosynthesis (AarF/ABC1/UbiB family)